MSGTFTVSKRGLRGFLNNSSLSFTFSNTLGGTILSKDAVPIAAGQWTDTGGSGGDFCMIPVAETDVDMGTLNYMALTYTMRLATSPTFQFRFACSLRHGGWIFGGFYNGLASFPVAQPAAWMPPVTQEPFPDWCRMLEPWGPGGTPSTFVGIHITGSTADGSDLRLNVYSAPAA